MIMINIQNEQQDVYSWRVYFGENYLDEANAPIGFASVDKIICSHLALLDQSDNIVHTVEIPDGCSPVFFRRRIVEINPTDDSHTRRGTTHCIGWKCSEDDAVYLFVFEDSSILLSTNLQAC